MRIIIICFLLLTYTSLNAQFLGKQKELKSYEGLFNFYYSEAKDAVYLEVDRLDEEFLYVHALVNGIGSNDIGLDRGQLGGGKIVRFEKKGNKIFLVQENLKYRANTNNALEKQSVKQAFARSVLFGFPVKEEINGKYIIDFTPFLLRDSHGVQERLKKRKEGSYELDISRSALIEDRLKAFPKNLEFESQLTFTGTPSGKYLASVVPDPKAITVVQHHSLVALPNSGYSMRAFDPRSGAISTSFYDYATPIQSPIKKQIILRHRLEKKDPEALKSEAKKPIVYYLDPGTPEPVKTALLEGASWWNEAFEAIGYTNAFQVKMLPVDADPLDLRYNVIQWVHRSTRGWSYGASIIDPRTGEILKGHVSLGSLRIRQDFLIAQALLDKPFANNDLNYEPMLNMALDRIKQLSAHEVGHTLGFAHNFAASSIERASVMDYPHPLVKLNRGKIDISDAYADGIGAWDKVTVAYSYSDFSKVNEKKQLDSILNNSYASGMRFITDSDARAKGGAHVKAHLWDNGTDMSDELDRILNIRKVAIETFSEDNIRKDEPFTVLEDVFVPLYFFHRYQTEAVIKSIAGLEYTYAIKGSEQPIMSILASEKQRKALTSICKTLTPEVLAIPKDKLKLFPPRAYGFARTRESFKSKTGVAFDAISAAATASEMTLSLLLHPERASRLIQQKSLDANQLGLSEVIDQLIMTIFDSKSLNSYTNEIKKNIQFLMIQHLLRLSKEKTVYPQVNAIALSKLNEVRKSLETDVFKGDKTFVSYLAYIIKEYTERTELIVPSTNVEIPDGSPIGSFECTF
ncbi:zinc-dependent metalloprotease [Aquimarina sp. W85]|uniref:zinc-dependent metalloprotease n=1 Tax=Aquimarina rhodophyticola TaxID=3342246 RepID=UPI00366CF8D1